MKLPPELDDELDDGPFEAQLTETLDLMAQAISQLAANQRELAQMANKTPAPSNPAPVVNVAPPPAYGYRATVTRDANGFITDMVLTPIRPTIN